MAWEGRIRPTVRALGRLPSCIGHYEAGNVECDVAPCTWRDGCSLWQRQCVETAKEVGAAPFDLIRALSAATPHHVLVYQIRDLIRSPPGGIADAASRYEAGWESFKHGLVDGGLTVLQHATRAVADLGELYWHVSVRIKVIRNAETQKVYRKKVVTAYLLRVKGSRPSSDTVLVRFRCRENTKAVKPIIEIRAPLRPILRAFPGATELCERWRGVGNAQGLRVKRLGATAVNARAERLADLGRLVARVVADGLMPGVTAERTRMLVTKESWKWRRWTGSRADSGRGTRSGS